MRLKLFMLLFLLGLSACSGDWSSYPVQTDVVIDKSQYIEIGDTLNVNIFEEESISGSYKVLRDGTIQIPLIGSIAVNKLLLTDASDVIAQALRKKGYLVNPKVTLSIAQSQTVNIIGEINGAGEYPYQDGLTILGVVAKAGGFSYRANQDSFDIVRKKTDTSEEVIKGQISTRVMPGDIIRVRERFF